MGYSVYYSIENNRFQGYGVPAYCDHPDCTNEIDRGISYVCCGDQLHTNSCGGYYCQDHEHLCLILLEEDFEGLTSDEISENFDLDECPEFDEDGYFYQCKHKPIQHKEHPEWVEHMSTDESWNVWRNENKELFNHMKSLVVKHGQ